jgi:non-specific serine/threonine protein kinase
MRGPRERISIVAVLAGLLLTAGLAVFLLTESAAERRLKDALGYHQGCDPMPTGRSAWRPEPSLPVPRDEPRAAVLDGRAYIVGGVDGVSGEGDALRLESVADVLRFDPRTGRYAAVTPLPDRLNHLGLVAYRGALYALGGWSAKIDVAAKPGFYRYSPRSGRWSRMPPPPVPRAAMAVGVVRDQLIVAGGMTRGRILRRVDGFDFRTRKWSRLADMPTRRQHIAGAVHDGKLYALGGRNRSVDALAIAERYDPVTNRWQRLPDMPVPTGGADAVALRDSVVAIGGGNDRAGTVTGAVQKYAVHTGGWTRLPEMRTPRHGFAAAVIGDRAFTFGGSPCAYFAATDSVESLGVLGAPTEVERSARLRVGRRGEQLVDVHEHAARATP